MTNITYTFPADFLFQDLRGVTATGGRFCHLYSDEIKDDEIPTAVIFETKTIYGGPILASIAGNPELEAALKDYLSQVR